MFLINEGEIFDVRSTKRFDWKMSVQMPITFPNMILAILYLQGPMEYFKVPLFYPFFCDNFVKSLLDRSILGLLGLNNFI